MGKLLQFTKRDKIQPCHVLNPLLWFGLHCIQIQCGTACMKWKLHLKAADLSVLWLFKLHKNSEWSGLKLELQEFFLLRPPNPKTAEGLPEPIWTKYHKINDFKYPGPFLTTLIKTGITKVHKNQRTLITWVLLAWMSISIDGWYIHSKTGHINFLYKELSNQKIQHDSIVL